MRDARHPCRARPRARGRAPARAHRVCGESGDPVARGREKLRRKQVDLIVANDITRTDAGFDSDSNAATLISGEGPDSDEVFPLGPKTALASRIIDRAEAFLEALSSGLRLLGSRLSRLSGSCSGKPFDHLLSKILAMSLVSRRALSRAVVRAVWYPSFRSWTTLTSRNTSDSSRNLASRASASTRAGGVAPGWCSRLERSSRRPLRPHRSRRLRSSRQWR